MLDDPVTVSALIVLIVVFFGLLIALTTLYLLIRSGERGEPKPPHKGQMWLAGLIGIVVPLLILAYAVAFSPAAKLSPDRLHQQELKKEIKQAQEKK